MKTCETIMTRHYTRILNILAAILLLGSSPLAQAMAMASAQVYYIHTDHLDTPRQITDTNGNLVWQWDNSDPFGNNADNENPTGQGQFTFNLRFPGQYFDAETNLNQNYFRDYDPSIGRYIEADPLGAVITNSDTATIELNHLYTYVDSNTMTYVDPLGLYHFVGKAKGPITDTQASLMACMDKCTGNDLAITSANDGTHTGPKDPHFKGKACDLGKNNNPTLTRDDVKACFTSCAAKLGITDSSWATEGEHDFHMQTTPAGNGTAIGFSKRIQ